MKCLPPTMLGLTLNEVDSLVLLRRDSSIARICLPVRVEVEAGGGVLVKPIDVLCLVHVRLPALCIYLHIVFNREGCSGIACCLVNRHWGSGVQDRPLIIILSG